MDYKELYKDLAWTLSGMGISVCDYDYLGYCGQTKKIEAFIVIKPSLSYKEKFFTLAHEAGHLFYMKKGNIFNLSKKSRSEDEANWFAIQYLRLKEINSNEYWHFYNKAKDRNSTRRKSWFEIGR
jgi:Zn-dependent peptidase ImmA (M78 family)